MVRAGRRRRRGKKKRERERDIYSYASNCLAGFAVLSSGNTNTEDRCMHTTRNVIETCLETAHGVIDTCSETTHGVTKIAEIKGRWRYNLNN